MEGFIFQKKKKNPEKQNQQKPQMEEGEKNQNYTKKSQ